MNQTIAFWRVPAVAAAVCACLASLGAGSAWADEDNTPLSLTLSQFVARDSNFSRNDNDRRSETTSTTAVRLGFDKKYGRQSYQAGFKLSAQRYHQFDQLNNDGKDANFAFSTGLARDWLVSANGLYSESLNAIESNVGQNRLEKNIRKYRDGGFNVQYGNGGTWAVVGSYASNKQSYSSDSQKYQNSNQRTVGVKGVYYSSDVLNYSLGTRRVVTEYPLNIGRYSKVVDRNVDFSTDWQVTGLSNLNATLTRRSSTYTPDTFAGSQGWTGSARWVYTPHGIVTYNMSLVRTTGTDRAVGIHDTGRVYLGSNDKVYELEKSNYDSVTTSLNAGANVQLTGKIGLNVGYSLNNFKVDKAVERSITDSLPGARTSSYSHTLSLGMDYAVMRTLTTGCDWQQYSQGANEAVGRLKYHGRSFSCNASFTLDSF